MDKILSNFVNYCEDNKSEETVYAYKKDIEQFLYYLKDKNIDLPIVSFSNIEDYKHYMIYIRKLNIKSINRKIVAIREFLTFSQIAVTVKPIKVQTQNFLEDIFSKNEVDRIIATAQRCEDYRAKALIMTLQLTGTRISECLQLKLNMINENSINIVGKGQKRRNIFIPKKLHSIWLEYLPYRINKSDALFTGKKGAITRKTGYNIIKNMGC